MLPIKFRVYWPFRSEKSSKINFEDGDSGGHLGYLIKAILAIFDIQVAPTLPTKIRVSWHFGSGEEFQNRFSRWWPYCISNRNDFSYFWSTSDPNTSYQVSSQLAFWLEKFKIDFQDGGHGVYPGFQNGTMLAIFDLQVALILPTKFHVKWPFSSEEAQNRFSRWPSWISDWSHFSYFWSRNCPDTSCQVNCPFSSGEEAQNIFSWWHIATMAIILAIRTILAIFILKVTLILPTKFGVNWPRGVGGVVFQSKLLTPLDGRLTSHQTVFVFRQVVKWTYWNFRTSMVKD